ncbi:hypothetical protein EV363DRAFT_1586690 [Boletus edulis]|nr:hypothetical protein EV363DRAFT_1586690 [Boletus edulis]
MSPSSASLGALALSQVNVLDSVIPQSCQATASSLDPIDVRGSFIEEESVPAITAFIPPDPFELSAWESANEQLAESGASLTSLSDTFVLFARGLVQTCRLLRLISLVMDTRGVYAKTRHSPIYGIPILDGRMSGLGLGVTIPFKWTKGLLDGVNSFDAELTRLQEDGLILLTKDVPTTYTALNILLQAVSAGDDYFIVCFNSSNSIIYSVSSRFTITTSSSGQSNPKPDPSVPTPDLANTRVLGLGGIVVLSAALSGGATTLW